MKNKKIVISILVFILVFYMSGIYCFADSRSCNVYYYGYSDESKNFGDALNKDLLNYFSINFEATEKKDAEYIFIGSILGWGYTQNINVFGAGFICEPESSYTFPQGINAYCLRGKKTKEYVKKITGDNLENCILGDPGLLCSKIFPEHEDKIYDVGIICHQCDKSSPYIKNIKLKNKSYKFIDINDSTENVCKQINQCKFILSSAMHGLIVSDSYGIPNQRIILSDSEDPACTRYNFKFDDYYSIYEGISIHKAVDLKYTFIEDEDVDKFTDDYSIPQGVIDDFCNKYTNLIKNYFSNLYPIDDGLYNIESKLKSNMVLDIAFANTSDTANLWLYEFNNTNAQKFILKSERNGYYSIKAKHSGKMLDVALGAKSIGTNVWQYSDNGTYAQRWKIEPSTDLGYYNIKSKCNNLYLDVENAGVSNMTNIQMYKFNSTDAQKFKLNKLN